MGSTNTLAFERARKGETGPLWFVAEEQSAGRGRRGRDWASNRGNLFASLLLTDPEPRDRIAELPLLAAVALAEAVDAAAGTHNLVSLKWPNDLLVEGAKLSGILLEAETTADGRLAVVLGFGVNCVTHPEASLYPCVDLAALGYRVEAENLFFQLTGALQSWMNGWKQPDGFGAVRGTWLSRAAHLGQEITVRSAQEEFSGKFLDLNTQGHLVLGLETGEEKTIFAGDVFLPGWKPDGSPAPS